MPCQACGGPTAANCASCKYDLRASDVDGTCPECNLPVATTLNISRLEHWDTPGLEQLSQGLGTLLKGMMWSLISIIAIIAFAVIWIFAAFAVAFAGFSNTSSGWLLVLAFPLLCAFAFFVSVFIGCKGYKALARAAALQRLTDPDAKQKDIISYVSGIQSRMSLLVLFAIACGVIGVLLFSSQTGSVHASFFLFGGFALTAVVVLLSVIRFFPACKLLGKLAWCGGDASLAAHAHRMLWLGPLLVGIGWLLGCAAFVGYPLVLVAWAMHGYGFYKLSKRVRAVLLQRKSSVPNLAVPSML